MNRLFIISSLILAISGCQNNQMCFNEATESLVFNNHGFRMLYFTNDDNLETYFVLKKAGIGKLTVFKLNNIDTNSVLCKRLGFKEQRLTKIPFEPKSSWTVSNQSNGDAAEYRMKFYINESGVFIANNTCN